MKKIDLYNTVRDELEDIKLSKKAMTDVMNIIDEYLKPKTGGGVSAHPMYTEDDINYHYCRYHQEYYP